MLIWQQWLLGEVTLQFIIYSVAILIFLYDVINWDASATSPMLKAFMKFWGTCFEFWLWPWILEFVEYQNMENCSVDVIGIRTETKQRIFSNWFLCVKDRTCLKAKRFYSTRQSVNTYVMMPTLLLIVAFRFKILISASYDSTEIEQFKH